MSGTAQVSARQGRGLETLAEFGCLSRRCVAGAWPPLSVGLQRPRVAPSEVCGAGKSESLRVWSDHALGCEKRPRGDLGATVRNSSWLLI